MTLKKSIFIVIAVLLTDQIFKFYIKLNYPLTLYGSDAIVDWGWFRLLFVENKGMAMGTKIAKVLHDEPVAKAIALAVKKITGAISNSGRSLLITPLT